MVRAAVPHAGHRRPRPVRAGGARVEAGHLGSYFTVRAVLTHAETTWDGRPFGAVPAGDVTG
ncbi:hypothetical protein CG747_23135 [Streptomyces sp. CB02959]|nr:hypothetical protein CG747_23135 [Streptomyces sp. CB02959]